MGTNIKQMLAEKFTEVIGALGKTDDPSLVEVNLIDLEHVLWVVCHLVPSDRNLRRATVAAQIAARSLDAEDYKKLGLRLEPGEIGRVKEVLGRLRDRLLAEESVDAVCLEWLDLTFFLSPQSKYHGFSASD